ncbi:sigma-70 family RNA polymerase sigma factor [Domibacillus sp. A3M-37]|uniref:sigma-70 family RNA polymerase sigma factor n=1 Tax=Domibacillus sp. A3M-37 TaxID=2962037 RepID=UPI0020B8630F|nr:sigma-70 family RNA polymerase sigma factor [Domibacillus sp. A3M-37]MCP3761413.1 sigma-70 family RNA polymerase sigma factor [Domibacillus sp. A3M-37]
MQFEQLAQQYNPMIHRIMNKLHIYKNKDDFHQVGLIALWEAHTRFDETKGDFTPYAYSYIQGRLKNALTKDAAFSDGTVLTGETALFEGADSGPTPESAAIVHLCGDKLEGRARKWFDLSIVGGLSNPDIARKCNVTPAAVRKWQQAAQKQLQEQFGDSR